MLFLFIILCTEFRCIFAILLTLLLVCDNIWHHTGHKARPWGWHRRRLWCPQRTRTWSPPCPPGPGWPWAEVQRGRWCWCWTPASTRIFAFGKTVKYIWAGGYICIPAAGQRWTQISDVENIWKSAVRVGSKMDGKKVAKYSSKSGKAPEQHRDGDCKDNHDHCCRHIGSWGGPAAEYSGVCWFQNKILVTFKRIWNLTKWYWAPVTTFLR